MFRLQGKIPGSATILETGFDRLIQTVDELIQPPETEAYLAPGFIDLQVNGFAGVDYNDPATSPEALFESLRTMFQTGVTRCFPTVITGSYERMANSLHNLAAAKEEFLGNGLPQGHAMEAFHVEGPYISPEDGPRGAHPIEHVRPPDISEFERLQEAARGHIRLVTVSPEWPQTPKFVEHLARSGVVASIGHTKANSKQIAAAASAGATMSTHLGNAAHSTLPKLENYIWDQVAEDRLAASFVVDGIHIPAAFFRGAVRAKGIERAVLVTDAVMPAMCAPGPYRLGQVDVDLRADGSVVLRGGTRLAGSALRMDAAIGNSVRLGGISIRDAITMATVNPARAGRIAGRQRGLSTGEKADLVRFQWDEATNSLTVLETIVAGQTVYSSRDQIN